MRTTLNLDNDIVNELKLYARQDGITVTAKANQVLRQGLIALQQKTKPKKKYRENLLDMGTPIINIDKAVSFAARLEDDEILRKIAMRQ